MSAMTHLVIYSPPGTQVAKAIDAVLLNNGLLILHCIFSERYSSLLTHTSDGSELQLIHCGGEQSHEYSVRFTWLL